jgi:hypothetical protein
LRADYEKTPAAKKRRKPEEVLRVGAPAMERKDCGERAFTGRLEDGVRKLH